jgi:hypothetical protein
MQWHRYLEQFLTAGASNHSRTSSDIGADASHLAINSSKVYLGFGLSISRPVVPTFTLSSSRIVGGIVSIMVSPYIVTYAEK